MFSRRVALIAHTALKVCVALALLAPTSANAQPRPTPRAPGLQLHERGAAELHAVATLDNDELTVHGELIDDAGTPIAAVAVLLSATAGDDRRSPVRINTLRPCSDPGRGTARLGPDDVTAETDDHGGFCVVGRTPGLSGPNAKLVLRFRGKGLYDATELTVPVEAVHEHLMHILLRFEPPPETIDLEKDSVVITAALRVDRNEAARALPGVSGSAQRANLPLVLTDERGAHVAEALTGGDGRARFEVKTTALAGPGTGELTVRFAGNAVLEAASWAQPIVRRAAASLSLAHPVAVADPEDGVTIDLDVAAALRPVSGGVVEVRRLRASDGLSPDDSGSLGAATVDASGHARVVAVFSSLGATHAPLALRYIPAAPWYRAGPTLEVDVPLARPGVGRSILLAILVLAAATWVVVGWRRPPPRRLEPGLEPTRAPPSGKAGVRVLAASDAKGWRGTVADAHDGSIIAGATLSIVVPSFEGDGVVATATTDEQGAFEIAADPRSDARLLVESPEHTTYEQALPPPSVLAVALVSRRRALLDRLVRWARRKGAPFDVAAEPTPGHVRRVAARASSGEIEAWATRVEQAVYGPAKVDAGVERDVRAEEPRALP